MIRYDQRAGKWVADARGPDGRRRRTWHSRKGDAVQAEALAKLRAPKSRSKPGASTLTLKTWAEDWIERRASGSDALAGATITLYRFNAARITKMLGDMPVASITRADLRAAFDRLSEKHAASTVATTRAVVGSIFRAAMVEGIIHSDPTAGMRSPRGRAREKVRALTQEQARSLLAHAAALDPDTHAALALGLLAGLRSGEILALRSCDIEARALRVEVSVSREDGVKVPKSSAGRRLVPIAAPLRDALDRLGTREFLVWPEVEREGEGIGLLQARLYTAARRACKAVGFEGGPHALRHTFCSLLVASGTPIAWVTKWAGHADISLTYRRYGRWLPPENEAAIVGLGTALSLPTTATQAADGSSREGASIVSDQQLATSGMVPA